MKTSGKHSSGLLLPAVYYCEQEQKVEAWERGYAYSYISQQLLLVEVSYTLTHRENSKVN